MVEGAGRPRRCVGWFGDRDWWGGQIQIEVQVERHLVCNWSREGTLEYLTCANELRDVWI